MTDYRGVVGRIATQLDRGQAPVWARLRQYLETTMETPKTAAGQLTERIMRAIREHIQPGGLNPGEVAHYNRAYEKVLAILQESK
jgi:hypothetical protein